MREKVARRLPNGRLAAQSTTPSCNAWNPEEQTMKLAPAGAALALLVANRHIAFLRQSQYASCR
jgi:hypothetical protein